MMLGRGWADSELIREELFDLSFDPNEANNLASHPGYRDVLEQMRSRLEGWLKRIVPNNTVSPCVENTEIEEAA